MRKVARIGIGMLVVAGLASCSVTTGLSKGDVALQKNLPKVCDALDTAHVAFAAIAATGKVSARTVAKESAAYAGVVVFCDNPSQATVATAIIKVMQASIVVTTALNEARKVNNG